jgi:hypothetical protein
MKMNLTYPFLASKFKNVEILKNDPNVSMKQKSVGVKHIQVADQTE